MKGAKAQSCKGSEAFAFHLINILTICHFDLQALGSEMTNLGLIPSF